MASDGFDIREQKTTPVGGVKPDGTHDEIHLDAVGSQKAALADTAGKPISPASEATMLQVLRQLKVMTNYLARSVGDLPPENEDDVLA